MEYNLLTRRLLAAGATADNHPDHVEVSTSRLPGTDPLNTLDGGFLYKWAWIMGQTFRAPCGMQCKGSSCMTGMWHGGIDWSFENDAPTIHCPHGREGCGLRHELLRDAKGILKDICSVRMAEGAYQYEGSNEQLLELREERISREKAEFIRQKGGRACPMHMRYDDGLEKWTMGHDPEECARNGCRGTCPILGRELDKKRGNVFYDVKTTFRRHDLDGTLFEGQTGSGMIKGRRMFDHSVSMDVCRLYVKMRKDRIVQKEKDAHHSQLFFAERHGREFSLEVLNIRAEQRESRDLLQDLQDARDGIEIWHDSDLGKEAAKEKREKSRQRRDSRIKKLEARLVKAGYWNLDEGSPDRTRADKWLTAERIGELEEIRWNKAREEREKAVQLSLFD